MGAVTHLRETAGTDGAARKLGGAGLRRDGMAIATSTIALNVPAKWEGLTEVEVRHAGELSS